MEFSEKLEALLTLTATTNVKLAKAIRIDRSQISRMKTGTRKRPKNDNLIKLISIYFAQHCSDEYLLSALEKLTNDFRINTEISEELLATILFDWLSTDEDTQAQSSTERFVYKVGQFSSDDSDDNLDSKTEPLDWLPNNDDYIIYYGNSGKRQALIDFFNLVLSAKCTQRLFISSDERNEWLFEDSHFLQVLSNAIQSCINKGISSTHIYSSNQDLDMALYAVQQWLKSYMQGNIKQYYYPMHRDKLYRRTLYVMSGVAALYSNSLSFQTESYMTILTTVKDAVESYTKEFVDVLSLCKPMNTVYTAQMWQKLFFRISRITEKSADSIFKFSSLPYHSVPNELIKYSCSQANTPLTNKVYENYLSGQKSRIKSLEQYSSVDIIRLAPLEQVRQGKVAIPDSSFFTDTSSYYMPDDYKHHLQTIVYELEQYKNYDVIISESTDLDSLVLYGIGTDIAIISKQSVPFAILEINEPEFACALIEFLHRFAKKERKNRSKQETISILKNYISQI